MSSAHQKFTEEEQTALVNYIREVAQTFTPQGANLPECRNLANGRGRRIDIRVVVKGLKIFRIYSKGRTLMLDGLEGQDITEPFLNGRINPLVGQHIRFGFRNQAHGVLDQLHLEAKTVGFPSAEVGWDYSARAMGEYYHLHLRGLTEEQLQQILTLLKPILHPTRFEKTDGTGD